MSSELYKVNKQRGKIQSNEVNACVEKENHLFHFSRFLQASYNGNKTDMTISKLLHEQIEWEGGREGERNKTKVCVCVISMTKERT